MKPFLTVFILLFCTTTRAANPPIVWGSPYAKLLTKGVQMSGSDTTTTCNAAVAGSIRYNAGTFEGCDGATWSTLGGGGGSGVTTMTAFGATPNADGASISGVNLTLQPADATHPGGIIVGAQTIAAPKTISSSSTAGISLLSVSSSGTTGANLGVDVSNASTNNNARGIQSAMSGTSGTTKSIVATNASTTANANGISSTMSGTTGAHQSYFGSNASTDSGARVYYGSLSDSSATGTTIEALNSGSGGWAIESRAEGTGNRNILKVRNFIAAANDSGARIGFYANRTTGGDTDVAGVVGIITDITNGAYKGALSFQTANNAAPAERMRINNTGAVNLSAYTTAGIFLNNTSGDIISAPSMDIINCSIGVTVGSSAVTFSLLDGAGNALSTSSPCLIPFRNVTDTNGTIAYVATTAASAGVNTVVGASGDSLGCPTASVACTIYVYAINNGGTVNIAAYVGGVLDEGSLQSSSALTGGADIAPYTLWSTSALSNKSVRLLSRVNITPAGSFAWTNSVTQISPGEVAFKKPWHIAATLSGGAVTWSTGAIGSSTELTNGGLTLTPKAESAPVGTMCSTTNAATAPSTGATTCSAGNESIGINFALPAPGLYQICFAAGIYCRLDSGVRCQPTFQLIETPTNAQTLTYQSGNAVGYVMAGETIAGGTSNDMSANISNCALFPWTGVAAGTIKGVRLMITQSVTGTPTTNGVLLDSADGRQGYWTVYRLN